MMDNLPFDNSNLPIYDDELKTVLVNHILKDEIDDAIKMFSTHKKEALVAIKEYNTESHSIMEREDKKRKNKADYRTNKLPRNWQQYINEISVFFMFNNRIKITLDNKKEEVEELKPYFESFQQYLDKIYFHERLRQSKRIAGSETECAKIYQLYTDSNNELKVRCRIVSNSGEHNLYTLFNQYGDLIAFGDRFYARNVQMEVIEHFDIYTDDITYNCTKTKSGWEIKGKINPIKKIPVIYYNQPKEWDGVEPRIERDEWLDSKAADTCEYFNDPYLKVSSEVVNNRLADAEEVGKVVKVSDKDSVFEFVAPPSAGDMLVNEKKTLKASILEGTFTPDFSYESIMGLGTLSGEAIRRMSLPGYIKRSTRLEIYNELINREFNLIKAILCNVLLIHDSASVEGIKRLKLNFEFQDPFLGSLENNSEEVQAWLTAGGMSIHTAVEMNKNVKDKELEYQRIIEEKKQFAEIESSKTVTESQTEVTGKEE